MNAEHPTSTSRNSSAILRPRSRRPAHDGGDSELQDEPSLTSAARLTPISSSSREASPIPSKHPSRTAASNRVVGESRSINTTLRAPSLFGSQPGPTAFAAGFWESSWSSLQGVASNLLGNETLKPPSASGSPTRKRRPLEGTRNSKTPILTGQWGPAGIGERQIGTGTREDRIAQVQVRKREALLLANGHLQPDGAGRLKRRGSDERDATSAPPSHSEDREALVYLHKVLAADTLAGISIKYSCPIPVLRKANRLWPNDSVQIRKVVYLPLDACGVKGHTVAPEETSANGLSSICPEDTMQTPTTTIHPFSPSANPISHRETPLSSVPTSPSISVTTASDDQPYTHDSWVTLPNFPHPIEIARLSRRSLGFFPPSRRKSLSFSPLSTPSASLDLPRASLEPRDYSRTRRRDKSHSSSTSFIDRLQGPGGVGTLGREVRSPGPAQDGLNKLFAAHLPNVAPRSSFDSTHSSSSTGIENVGGAIEGWVRRIASKAKESVQPPGRSERVLEGDLIELSDASEAVEGRDEVAGGGELDRGGPGTEEDEQERLLRERFPPRGRVFGESSPRRRGV